MIDLKDDEVWAEEIRKQLRNTRPSFDAQLTLTIRPVHKPLAGALDMTAPVIGATGIRFLPPGLRKLFDGPLAAGADIVPYALYYCVWMNGAMKSGKECSLSSYLLG